MKFLIGELEAPDIPEGFLQDHEDGKVVFFCGAGISYSAGLPGFKGLVEQVYNNLGYNTRNPTQQVAFKNHQYDVAISLLESSITEGRSRVREQIAKILCNPKISKKSTMLHNSLLTLSKNREGKTKLVTTNFDRLFERVISDNGLTKKTFIAPTLPIINERWDGIVYLHGLLNKEPELGENGTIVVSSGDFGQAYLIDRWAARFLGQLFKKYSVCFIGYSLEDPVVRYMTDALAAAKNLGENSPEMYAFCAYKGSGKEAIKNMWESKGVTPIPYNQKKNHFLLLETVKMWSKTCQEGREGKVSIVNSLKGIKPLSSTAEDDIVGKMIWALSDPTGKPAETFANANPVFDLAWLSAFCEKKYLSKDLALFGINKPGERKFEDEYTFLRRPYTDTQKPPTMSLVSSELLWKQNDKVMNWIAHWLVRHLNNPILIVWVSERGGVLHHEFRRLIINRLNKIAELVNDGKSEELEKIKKNSPDGIPDEAMKSLWELVLSGKLNMPVEGFSLIRAHNYIEKYGLDFPLKNLLLKGLSPTVVLHERMKYGLESYNENGIREIPNIVNAEVVICNQAISFVEIVKNLPRWKECLPDLIVDLTLLLKEAMDLQKTLGKISDDYDYTYIEINSINEIKDREARNSWIFLVRMVRDSWQELNKKRVGYANLVVRLWWNYPYPIFKRLSFLALSQQDTVDIEQTIQWFKENRGKWLWSFETQFEVLQLLKKIASICTKSGIERIINLLIEELPDEFSRADTELSIKEEYYDRATWLRLGVIKKASPIGLGNLAEKRFADIIEKYHLPEVVNQEYEYPIRMSTTFDSEFVKIQLPRNPDALYIEIKNNQERKNWEADDWKSLCNDELNLVVDVLLKLNDEGFDSFHWWDSAFNNWTDEKIVDASWSALSTKIESFSDNFFASCSYGLSRWLQANAKRISQDESLILTLVDRTIFCSPFNDKICSLVNDEIGTDYVQLAINSSVGICTSALLNLWFNKKPKDSELLPKNIKQRFTKICTQIEEKYIYGKVILASSIISLFRVDPEWTKAFLIPLFNWNDGGVNVVAVWQGFLWNPRINSSLLYELKEFLLQTIIHYNDLQLGSTNYVRLITHIGIYKPKFFNYNEIATIISQFKTKDLILVSDFMKEVVEGAGEKIGEIWDHQLYKFFHYCWPKSRSLYDENIAQTIALMCISAGGIIEKVYREVQFNISEIEYPDYVLMELEKTELCKKFPETTLFLIDKIIGSNSKLMNSNHIKSCLDKIKYSNSSLQYNERFQRLISFA